MIGQTISHYRILEKLGEGGMGVVYKAQDLKLERLVALKCLPQHITASEQEKARFIQEAKAAAVLSHPNICPVHAIEEHGGQLFLVMDYVDGQTLHDKAVVIRGSPMPIKQIVDICIQVAGGLAAAHEHGIVHRDIKPENIMVRKDGIVQITDFGLAKLRGVTRLTTEGSTVGTISYMSPEQVQGLDTDDRTDIFSLGVVLYELLTGELPFRAAHQTAMLYEIVNVDPKPVSSLREGIDPELEKIVMECLEKDREDRYQSAKQLSRDLRHFKRDSGGKIQIRKSVTQQLSIPSESETHGAMEPPVRRKTLTLAWTILTILFFVSSLTLAVLYFKRPPKGMQSFHTTLLPPERMIIADIFGGNLSLSPDGLKLALVASDSMGKHHLWVRPLNALSAQQLAGTDGAYYPFWSPDGRYIGFFSSGKLRRIDASGGTPLGICDAPNGRGGTWNEDGVIVFAPDAGGGLYQVSAAGGKPTVITKLDSSRRELTHRWPHFLPDGKRFLYFAYIAPGSKANAIYIASLDRKLNKLLLPAQSNMNYASGYLLFFQQTALMAQPFDEKRLELTGDAVPIAEQVRYDPGFSRADFSVSENGVLIYRAGSTQATSMLVWLDRKGKRIGSVGEPLVFLDARLSPDEKRIALDLFDLQLRNRQIWMYEMARGTKMRLTFDPSVNFAPVWSPDGNYVAFCSDRKGHNDLFRKTSTGGEGDELLLESNLEKTPKDWSSDGRFIIYETVGDPKTEEDLWILPLFGDRKPYPFLQTEFVETDARFSPDGRWVAYVSNETGQLEVYVRPFSGPGDQPASGLAGKWQVSTTGGRSPRWRRDGKELFFYSYGDGKMMSVEVKVSGAKFEVGLLRPLFSIDSKGHNEFKGVSADGERFLMKVAAGEASAPITLVTSWDMELGKK